MVEIAQFQIMFDNDSMALYVRDGLFSIHIVFLWIANVEVIILMLILNLS